jgi:hypothetical protein
MSNPGESSETPALRGAIQRLKDGSAPIKIKTRKLTEQLASLEHWLSRLPGRSEASTWTTVDDDPSGLTEFGVRSERSGKSWRLMFAYSRADEQAEFVSWKAIDEASLDEKLMAIRLLPALLESMTDAQVELGKSLDSANATLETLIDHISREVKEGD